MIIWPVLLFISLVCIYNIRTSNFVDYDSLFPARVNGTIKDSIDILLNRLDYGNNIDSKLNTNSWLVLKSIILSFFLSVFLLNTIPTTRIFLSTVFIVFIILNAFKNYSKHHETNCINYFMDRNIQLIRVKLNIKKRKTNLIPNIETRINPQYYIHKDL